MTKLGGHKPDYYGYTWKLCPYSSQYKAQYYDNGFNGNSNNPNLPIPDAHITDHDEDGGTMRMYNRAGVPGWICMDTGCYHYLTYGEFYFES